MAFKTKAALASSLILAYLATTRGHSVLGGNFPFFSTFAALFFLQLSCWVVWIVILWPKFLSPLRRLPGPKGGHFLMGFRPLIQSLPSGLPMLEWINTIPNDGLIYYNGAYNRETLLLTSPKALAEVQVTQQHDWIKPPTLRHSIGRFLGIGVLLAEGEEHKHQRRNLMPAFAFRHIKGLYPTFWDKARESVHVMTDHIRAEAAKQQSLAGADLDAAVLEIDTWASRVTLDIIGVAGMDQDFNSIKDPNNSLARIYHKVFRPSSASRLVYALTAVMPVWLSTRLPLKSNIEYARANQTIRSICRGLIRDKQEKLKRATEKPDIDILSVALESGAFTAENLVDQMMTFLAAGHETVATAMVFAVYLLSLHPDVQTRLRAEIRANLPSLIDTTAAPTSAEIDNLPYLQAFCNEVLRFYPPVPLVFRVALRNTEIIGHHVPKGTHVVLVPWAVNRANSLWGDDALEFKPERWLSKPASSNAAAPPPMPAVDHLANGGESGVFNGSGGGASNYANLTFLHGPRGCIGTAFAKSEFSCLVAAWVGRFEFALYDEAQRDEAKLELCGSVTMHPASDLRIRTRIVEGW